MITVRLLCCLAGMLLDQAVIAQTPDAGQAAVPGADAVRSLAIKLSRPYIDIVFDRYGKRIPVFEGEGEFGLWFRIRNNFLVPIKVYTLRRHNDNAGALLVHDVVSEQLSPVANIEGPRPAIGKPIGYLNPDIVNSEEIEPNRELLFSVPLSHVTRRWSISVEVFPSDLASGPGKQPRIFVECDWAALPPEVQKASDAKLFGRALPMGRQ